MADGARSGRLKRMLNSLFNLGALGVVEAVKCTNKIPCDASDAVEIDRSELIFNVNIFAV